MNKKLKQILIINLIYSLVGTIIILLIISPIVALGIIENSVNFIDIISVSIEYFIKIAIFISFLSICSELLDLFKSEKIKRVTLLSIFFLGISLIIMDSIYIPGSMKFIWDNMLFLLFLILFPVYYVNKKLISQLEVVEK